VNQKTLGFGANVVGPKDQTTGNILQKIQPEDLLNYGLIPEFVGRLPVIATLDSLDEKAFMRILREPRNALTKQYEKLFSFEKVKLRFTESALAAIAKKGYSRKTGARGLRSIMEEALLNLMYDLPSRKDIKECVITEETISGSGQAVLIPHQDTDVKSA
jgi:ATP-dependent Clp protease ATP-binding subunit ClpX